MENSSNIQDKLDYIKNRILEQFKNRVIFIGHIGSWARNEAGPDSDIDINLILDTITTQDIRTYKQILKSLPFPEKVCGFFGTKSELEAWPRFDRFHFLMGCRVLHGEAESIMGKVTRESIIEFIKTSASIILHSARHTYLCTGNEADEVDSLRESFKTCFFVLQAKLYLKYGRYIPTKLEMARLLEDEPDKVVAEIALSWNNLDKDRKENPDYYFNILAEWGASALIWAHKESERTTAGFPQTVR